MLKYQIPDSGNIEIENMVLDYDGTIAVKGEDSRRRRGIRKTFHICRYNPSDPL